MSKSAEDTSSAFIKMLKNLFEKMFGKKGGTGEPDPLKKDDKDKASAEEQKKAEQEKKDQAIEKLIDLGSRLEAERDASLEKGDFLKAYVLEHQRLTVEALHSTAELDKKPEELAEIAKGNIDNAFEKLQTSDTVQEQFQDYHNHDPEKLATATKEANDFVITQTKDIGFGDFGNNLNSSMKIASTHATDFMKESPESPAQKAGLEPTEAEKKAETENKATASNDNNHEHAAEASEPGMTPGA